MRKKRQNENFYSRNRRRTSRNAFIVIASFFILESKALEISNTLIDKVEENDVNGIFALRRGNRSLSPQPWQDPPTSVEEKISLFAWNQDNNVAIADDDEMVVADFAGRRDNPLFHCEQPLPTVHYDENRKRKGEAKVALSIFYDYARWFHNQFYVTKLAPHTMNQQLFLSQQSVARGPHKQLFTTLWNSPNFALWGRTTVGMGNEMSAYEDEKDNDNMIVQSDNGNTTSIHAIEGKFMIGGFPHVYVHPSTKPMSRLHNITTLTNGPVPYVAFVSNAIGVYAHFMMDHLPYWIFLRSVFDDPQTRFIFADFKEKNRERMEMLDPEFNKRIDWIQCSYEKRCNTLVRIRQGGSLSILTTDDLNGRHMALLDLARQWVSKVYPPPLPPLPERPQSTQPTVIYYTRNSPDVLHSRKMEPILEERIIKHIRKALLDNNRPEKLVVFDGNNISMKDQIDLFRTATTVIGPHGGGLSNLFWIPDAPTCEERPRVLEFLISPHTRTVQRGYLAKSWYKLYNTAPWLDYHHIFLVPPSNHETLYINLEDLDEALRVLFATPV